MAVKKNGKANEISYKIIENCGVISTRGNYTLELRYISWNSGEPKYDLRTWTQTETGEKCGKGITLSGEELESLGTLIAKMMEEGDENDD